MAGNNLAARVASLEAEMALYRREIEEFNAHIARLITTIRTLCCAVSNLQDFTYNQQDDKNDPGFTPECLSEDTTEDSDGNSNGSDDRSDGAATLPAGEAIEVEGPEEEEEGQ
ncbi:hypothetical protein RHMOL_Rhmol08G0125100 [Rhododendron molle]|uniref:Uncharacterized protein n=1 Tax=Rhododendron molle TaxID=49168 RepID=A0ACC0MP56_RHOML|nr:hypothetical protein RHMOL_Rhmol08G0125100 [Rhododendron molle]